MLRAPQCCGARLKENEMTDINVLLRSSFGFVQPNRTLSRKALATIFATQGAIALLIWMYRSWEVLPTPVEVFASLQRLWMSQGLARELATSVALNAEALVIATAISLAIAYCSIMPLARPLVALVSKARFLGMAGLTLVFTLAVGGGHPLKVALLVFGISVFYATSMTATIATIDREKFDHARTLGMSEWRIVWEVVVRGTLADALEGLRQNAAIGWMMLTMVEGISRAEGGLGAMLLNQNKHFHLAEVFAIQLLIVVVGVTQDALLGKFRRMVCPYAELKVVER
jgi:NitT/TauT family transport system permease protein